jgi:hypothetical protein
MVAKAGFVLTEDIDVVLGSKSVWGRPKGELSDREELERELCGLDQV